MWREVRGCSQFGFNLPRGGALSAAVAAAGLPQRHASALRAPVRGGANLPTSENSISPELSSSTWSVAERARQQGVTGYKQAAQTKPGSGRVQARHLGMLPAF